MLEVASAPSLIQNSKFVLLFNRRLIVSAPHALVSVEPKLSVCCELPVKTNFCRQLKLEEILRPSAKSILSGVPVQMELNGDVFLLRTTDDADALIEESNAIRDPKIALIEPPIAT